jgi:hypothetical protein
MSLLISINNVIENSALRGQRPFDITTLHKVTHLKCRH